MINSIPFWLKILSFFFIPTIFGIIVSSRMIKDRRVEILIPLGFFIGLATFVFVLNSVSFLIKGGLSVITTEALLLLASWFIVNWKKIREIKVPQGKSRLLVLFSYISWGAFLYWSIGRFQFGGDVEIFYSIGKTFVKGNFPVVSPWQPDLSVAYHYGVPILFGSIEWFTKLPFDFVHRAFALIMILMFSQLLIWFWKRHLTTRSLMFYQFMAFIGCLSCGLWFLVWPQFPLQLPEIRTIAELIKWGANLPTAGNSFETYGGTITNLGGLVYFITSSTGLILSIVILILVWMMDEKNRYFNWIFLAIFLAALTLINEVFIFIIAPALAIIILSSELKNKTFKKSWKVLLALVTILGAVMFLQGGVLTDSFVKPHTKERAVLIFPKDEDFPFEPGKLSNIFSYHNNQQATHSLPLRQEWLPFRWYHIGFTWLYLISVVILITLCAKKRWKLSLISLSLILSAAIATLLYNIVVPRYIPANGNRLMTTAFFFLGLNIGLSFVWFTDYLFHRKRIVMGWLAFLVCFLLFLPTLFQSVTFILSLKANYNQLKPIAHGKQDVIAWLEENVPYDSRVLDLVKESPFTARPLLTLREAGVMTPVFSPPHRAYTIEASPEYVDAVYTLNPSILRKLKINYLVVDSDYLQTLPKQRQHELLHPGNFKIVYESSANNNQRWERVYQIRGAYLNTASDLGGSYEQLQKVIPKGAAIYIDEWRDINPWSSLRKSLIFALKDWHPYLVWGPGVYLNVDTFVVTKPPLPKPKYDYLVLYKDTDPDTVCECRSSLVWQGIQDNIKLWKVQQDD